MGWCSKKVGVVFQKVVPESPTLYTTRIKNCKHEKAKEACVLESYVMYICIALK